MTTRSRVLALVLVAGLFALPHAAAAGKIKSPMWVSLAANGDILSASSDQITTPFFDNPVGSQVVYFTQVDLTGCVATATTSQGWVADVGVIIGEPASDGITVITLNSTTGAPVDVPFHLIVMCPK